MRPEVWSPPVAPSVAEQAVIKAVRRAKLFVFLRQHRHELFDEEFQAELARAYADSPKGQPPTPPAQLALATIVQAYAGRRDRRGGRRRRGCRSWPPPARRPRSTGTGTIPRPGIWP
jgi:hypothetical protein